MAQVNDLDFEQEGQLDTSGAVDYTKKQPYKSEDVANAPVDQGLEKNTDNFPTPIDQPQVAQRDNTADTKAEAHRDDPSVE